MKELNLILLLICFSCSSLLSQEKDVRENLYFHVNTQTLISGETLTFSAYCTSEKTHQLSNLSKILYVELIGEKGPVAQQKIKMVAGKASGEIFIGSLLLTGKYQLVAYTRWMKNTNDLFQLPIDIINPFNSYQLGNNKDKELTFSIVETNQALIADSKNLVGFSIENTNNQFKNIKGKVIDNEGNTVVDFKPTVNGMGTFQITPSLENNYKIVIEDQTGNLKVFPFPSITKNKVIIQVTDNITNYEVLVSGNTLSKEPIEIKFSTMQEIITSEKGVLNIPTYFKKESFPKSLVQIVVYQGGQKLANKWLDLSKNKQITASTEVKNYNKREKVLLNLNVDPGNYSISIRKKDAIGDGNLVHTVHADKWFNLSYGANHLSYLNDINLLNAHGLIRNPIILEDSIKYLPESRNELISGVAKFENGTLAKQIPLAFSIPGKQYQFKTFTTSDKGEFLFQYKPIYNRNSVGYITPLDTAQKIVFELNDKFLENPPSFDYSSVNLDSIDIVNIIAKSKRVQVENAYFVEIADSAAFINERIPKLLSNFEGEYQLADYTQFKKLKDYFLEIMMGASIKKGRLNVLNTLNLSFFDGPQLVLLDGVPVDPGKILEINALKVKSIQVANRKVFLGNLTFDGIVNLETIDGDLMGFSPGLSNGSQIIDITGLTQKVSDEFLSIPVNLPLPDQRDQLYWNPMIKHAGGVLPVKFSTSDVTGEFEMCLEGYSEEGKPVTLIRTFITK